METISTHASKLWFYEYGSEYRIKCGEIDQPICLRRAFAFVLKASLGAGIGLAVGRAAFIPRFAFNFLSLAPLVLAMKYDDKMSASSTRDLAFGCGMTWAIIGLADFYRAGVAFSQTVTHTNRNWPLTGRFLSGTLAVLPAMAYSICLTAGSVGVLVGRYPEPLDEN